MVTLVDTNVIIDVLVGDLVWADWSQIQLEAAESEGPIIINAVVYAELASRFESIGDLEAALEDASLTVEDIPRAALFLASKAFLKYKSAGGTRSGVLPDFFIGAHAAVESMPLLTRDAARYRTYFPTVKLITPTPLS